MATRLTSKLASAITSEPSGARFSRDRSYRYLLWRTWDPDCERRAVFIGLNPSKADEATNDPTIRRCVGITKDFKPDWRCGGLLVVNLYAWCTPFPSELRTADDPTGSASVHWLGQVCRLFPHSLAIAMWGNHGKQMGQADKFERQCHKLGQPLYCLQRNKGGQPAHPLYLPTGTQPRPYQSASLSA